MNSKKCNCIDSCDCKDEIVSAKDFVKKLPPLIPSRKSETIAHFDLKGSTIQIRKKPVETITKMLLHNKMCKNIVEKNQGVVIKELGDAILVVFKTPQIACECGIKVIRNLKLYGEGILTKVTVARGALYHVTTTNEEDIYGQAVNLCDRMSKYSDDNCILFEEDAYSAIEYWLSDDKKIKFEKVQNNGEDIDLMSFGPTPMRKIVVK